MKNQTTKNTTPLNIERSRDLRQRITPAEEKLWPYLRNRRLWGLKFRRQHPIDRFIVDFICMEEKLVLEIDGEIHNAPEQQEYDRKRTIILEGYGLKVIRFTNHEVLSNVHNVLAKIKKYLKS